MEQAPQTSKPYKRRLRSVLIHKPIQREFTLVVMTLLMISALAVGLVIHSTIQQAMMGGGYRFGKVSAFEVMSDVQYDLITRVSLILFITVLIIGLFGVFFLHRIAGPVYRFQMILRRIARGETPDEFKLREGDFFIETADDLNRVLKLLKDRKAHIVDLEARVETSLKQNHPGTVASLLTEIKKTLGQIK